jgi:hypothetical protein
MDIKDFGKNNIILDGQIIYFVDEDILNKLKLDPKIDNVGISHINILKLMEKNWSLQGNIQCLGLDYLNFNIHKKVIGLVNYCFCMEVIGGV